MKSDVLEEVIKINFIKFLFYFRLFYTSKFFSLLIIHNNKILKACFLYNYRYMYILQTLSLANFGFRIYLKLTFLIFNF